MYDTNVDVTKGKVQSEKYICINFNSTSVTMLKLYSRTIVCVSRIVRTW